MRSGEVIAGRFEVERLAGTGGMGAVHRALDRMTGTRVGLKIIADRHQDVERSLREARILSTLRHPAIVRYVAHGVSDDGHPYLAMDWLDGEDLAERLVRGPLSVLEAIQVARRVADALSAAHGHGIVHRDVKPGNVFLVGRDAASAVLLDFGIARLRPADAWSAAGALTAEGVLLGTAGYMSPEQARCDVVIDARTDVFGLGCVLFECLTGVRAFSGSSIAAVLAKILTQDLAHVRQYRPDVPQSLEELLLRMCARERAARVPSCDVVTEQLAIIERDLDKSAAASAAEGLVRLSGGEALLASVMLVAAGDGARVASLAAAHGWECMRIADGKWLLHMGSGEPSIDRVFAAGECALSLRRELAGARVAIATGRTDTRRSLEPIVEKASRMLARCPANGIRADHVTAMLLDQHYETEEADETEEAEATEATEEADETRKTGNHALLGPRAELASPRVLLGRSTAFVGRSKELALLDGVLRESIDESVARAVLVTGPAGQGKSRLRHEFVVRVRERYPKIGVLLARGEAAAPGSAFTVARQLIRSAVGVREGEPVETGAARLHAHVAELAPGGDGRRIGEFLQELIGVPAATPHSPQLRAARNDLQIMSEWLRRSFGEWLAAECSRRPLLVVTEDLHWCDTSSLGYLGEALKSLSQRSLMLLILGRPEAQRLFAGTWRGIEKLDLALGSLTPTAAQRLVHDALGASVSLEIVSTLVRRADGNPFYLEELIRQHASGGVDPRRPMERTVTVLALVQSRLERLGAPARRVIRAASVFGGTFWRGGVAALLGEHGVEPTAPITADGEGAPGWQSLDTWLSELEASEMVCRASESRFAGEREYAFRHELLRDAAYATLTQDDRRTGHCLAARWLVAAGEKDALRIALNFELGEDSSSALPWLMQAQQAAYYGGQVGASLAYGDRALACSPTGDDRGYVLLVQALCYALRGRWDESLRSAREAEALLIHGSERWFLAAASVLLAATFLGQLDTAAALLPKVLAAPPPLVPSGPYGLAIFHAYIGLLGIGEVDLASNLLEGAGALGRGGELDPAFSVRLDVARGFRCLSTSELGESIAIFAQARARAHSVGDAWGQAAAGVHQVAAVAEAGDLEQATELAEAMTRLCAQWGLGMFSNWNALYLAVAERHARRSEQAEARLRPLLDLPEPLLVAFARTLLAHVLIDTGDVRAAAELAHDVLSDGAIYPAAQSSALSVLAVLRLAEGRPGDALGCTEEALAVSASGLWPRDLSVLLLARAEALDALGRREEAAAAIEKASARLLRVAAGLAAPGLRAMYLERVPEHARTLQRASEWGRAATSGYGNVGEMDFGRVVGH